MTDSWTDQAVTFALSAVALYVVCFPGLAVLYALATGAPIYAREPQVAAAALAVAGTYPFVAGAWSTRRLGRFAVGLWVASGAVGMVGLVVVANADVSLPSAVVARAVVLAVAYPTAVAVAFRDRFGVDVRGPSVGP